MRADLTMLPIGEIVGVMFLDLVTTGRNVQTDRIVEISTLKLRPNRSHKTHNPRLNPGIPIPAQATAIHGITEADEANENSFRQIARSLAAYLEDCDLCGHNIWISVPKSTFRQGNNVLSAFPC
jgi:DNA polymerase III subunit epsilon